jgi:hypothetical protein
MGNKVRRLQQQGRTASHEGGLLLQALGQVLRCLWRLQWRMQQQSLLQQMLLQQVMASVCQGPG